MKEMKLFIEGKEEGGFHPYFYKSNFDYWGMALLFQGLNMYDSHSELINRLTEYVIHNNDYLEVKLKDVRWHDGTFLTSDDFIYSFHTWNSAESRFKNLRVTRSLIGISEYHDGSSDRITGVSKINDCIFRLNCNYKDDNLKNALLIPIVPNASLDKIEKIYLRDQNYVEHNSNSLIGCGSFTLIEKKEKEILFYKNTDFVLGNPKLDKMVLFGGSKNEKIELLKGMLVDFTLIDIDEEKHVDKSVYDVYSLPQLTSTVISLNYNEPINRELNFRRFISSIIDRDLMVNNLFNGHAVPLYQMYPQVLIDKYRLNNCKQDVDDTLNYSDLTISISFRKDKQNHKLFVNFLKVILKKYNININVFNHESAKVAFSQGIMWYINDYSNLIIPYSNTYFDFFYDNIGKCEDLKPLVSSSEKLMEPTHNMQNVKRFSDLTAKLLPCIPLYNENEIQVIKKKYTNIKADSRGVLWNIHEIDIKEEEYE